MALLLFDIDGTLLAGGLGHPAMTRAGRRLFGTGFSLDGVALSGRLDRQIYRDLHALGARLTPPDGAPAPDATAAWPAFRRAYLEELAREAQVAGAARALPGVMALLDALRPRSDLTLGLLTGNLRAAAPLKLRAAGIDPGWFPVGAFGDEADERADLVPLARERHRLHSGRDEAPERVLVIGDTPNDVACAHAHGCRAVAVATGRYARAELAPCDPDLLLDDLTDPAALLALLH